MRAVPRADRRRARGAGDLPFDGEPELPRTDGLGRRVDLHRLAVCGGSRRAHGGDRRSAPVPRGERRRVRRPRRPAALGAGRSRGGLGPVRRSLPRADAHGSAPRRRRGDRRLSRAWVFGDDLDTDQIVPGRYAPFMVGQDKFHTYAFCDARPGFAKEVRPGDILVGGENFGCGSSREYAVAALAKLGVGAVVAKSFARIFFRNCINLGIPAIESADAVEIVRDGDDVRLDVAAGLLRTPRGAAAVRPLASFAQEILSAGGVVAYLREHGDFPRV